MSLEKLLDIDRLLLSSEKDNLKKVDAEIMWRKILKISRFRFHQGFLIRTDSMLDKVCEVVSDKYQNFGTQIVKFLETVRKSNEAQQMFYSKIYSEFGINILEEPTVEELEVFAPFYEAKSTDQLSELNKVTLLEYLLAS